MSTRQKVLIGLLSATACVLVGGVIVVLFLALSGGGTLGGLPETPTAVPIIVDAPSIIGLTSDEVPEPIRGLQRRWNAKARNRSITFRTVASGWCSRVWVRAKKCRSVFGMTARPRQWITITYKAGILFWMIGD